MNNKQFIAREFINNIYKNSKKPLSLEYCDDDAIYNITYTLNWTKELKDGFIEKIDNFDKEIKALSKFSKIEANKIFTKYFGKTKEYVFKKHLKQRTYRLNKLNSVGAPKLITDNELQLIITLLIINNFALKDSITKEIKEDLSCYG